MIVRHTRKRPMEAWLGGFTALLGVWIALPSTSMGSVGYFELLEMQRELLWGLLFMAIGVAHVVSVILNGLRWWTPFARSFTAFSMAVIYGAWVWGFALVNPSSTAVFLYGAFTIASVQALRAALFDAAKKIGAACAGIYE